MYKKTAKSLYIFFFVDMISYSLAVLVYTNERLNADVFNQDTFMWYFISICYFLNLPHILTGVSYLYLKSHSDLIMELSKLDYLLIVSIFQREKEPILDNRLHNIIEREHRFSSFRMMLQQNGILISGMSSLYKEVLDESEEMNRQIRHQQIQEETLDSKYEIRKETEGDGD